MRLHMVLPAIACFFATLYSTMAGPPRRDNHLSQREQDVAEFAKLLVTNDISDLPAYFSFWHSNAWLRFNTVQATASRTFRVVNVAYLHPERGSRSHSFIFVDDTRCILHTRDTRQLLYGGFVDLTGDGQTEKVAVFTIDPDDDDAAESEIGKRRLRAWTFTDDSPTLILDAIFTRWRYGDGDNFISVQLVQPHDAVEWSISLQASSGKSHGRFHWSKEKSEIVHEGLDERTCRVRKLDRDTVGRCPMHPDLEITRDTGCPVCDMRLPD